MAAAALGLAMGGPVAAETYDVAIVNGRVMDPQTGLDAVRNLGVARGSIARITSDAIEGKRVIDAKGLVVSPGFIDLHAHDLDPFTEKLHAQDGVTTALELENGAFPLERWYARRVGASPINFGASAAHGPIRAVAFGAVEADRLTGEGEADAKLVEGKSEWMEAPSTPAQRARMTALISSELDRGALGVGYHIATTPGADSGELTEFFGLAAKHGVANFIHMRSAEQAAPIDAAKETIAAAKAAGASVHLVHVNSSSLWETPQVLAEIDRAASNGVDVTTEAYPYTGAASSLDDPRAGPESMAAFRADYSDLELLATGERLTAASFARYKKLYPHGELVAHIMKQADVDAAIEHAGVMVASDGGAYYDGKGHPRSAGTFSRIFSRYVRERKTLSLMEAIAKVSYLPAKRLEAFVPEMKRRGRLQEGAVADITVFDPAKIQDRATYGDSALPSAGIAYVMVSGQFVVDRYAFVEGARPGQPIYSAARAK